jgi:hypothetical protein
MDNKTQKQKEYIAPPTMVKLRFKLLAKRRYTQALKKELLTAIPGVEFQSRVSDQIAEVMNQFKIITTDPLKLDMLERVEKLMYLSFTLLTARDNVERLKHIGSYLVYTSNGSVLRKGQKFVENLVQNLFPAEEPEFQSSALREALDNWDRANESSLATKLRAVASYCMAFSLLEKWGLHEEFAEVVYAEFRVEKEKKKITSFAYAILDVIEFVLSKAKICYDSGSLVPLFHSSSTYLDWFAKVDEVKLMSRMKIGSELSGFKDADYFKLLEECINRGEALVKFAKTNNERKIMSNLLSDLKILRHDQMIEQNVSKTREMPFAVLVFGNSSIGKSTITEVLGKHYARVMGLDYDPSIIYYRSSLDQYMSEYTSAKWMIVLDDLACLEPSKCTNGDLSIIDAIQLINCAPYLSNQAELEKKGKVPVLAKLVIANTNVKNLSVFDYFAHPSAVQRRFNFVATPSVKEAFRQTDTNGRKIDALDGALAKAWQDAHPPIDGSEQLPDFWDFEILEWLPAPVGNGKQLALEHYPFGDKKIGMREMLDYYENRIHKHIRAQFTMTKNVDGLRKAKVCGICHTDRGFCADREEHKVLDGAFCADCNKPDCMYFNSCRKCTQCHTPVAKCVCGTHKHASYTWMTVRKLLRDTGVVFLHPCGGKATLIKNHVSCDTCDLNSKIDPLIYARFPKVNEPYPYFPSQDKDDLLSDRFDLEVVALAAAVVPQLVVSNPLIEVPEPETVSKAPVPVFQNKLELMHCTTCGYLDCLWFGNMDHVVGTCNTCKRCLSDEDVFDGCTYCAVHAAHEMQSNDTLWSVIYTLAMAYMAYQLGVKRSNPTMQNDIADRFTSLVPTYEQSGILASAMNTIRNMYITGSERLALATTQGTEIIVHTAAGVRRTLTRAQQSVAIAGHGYHFYTQYLSARNVMCEFGDRMQNFVSKTMLATVCGAVLAGVALAKLATRTHEAFELQSSVKAATETMDPWKREKYQLSKLDVGASVNDMRQYTREQFGSMVIDNTVHLEVMANGIKNETKALAFADRYYLVNLHALPKLGDFKVNIYRETLTDGVNQNLMNVVFTQLQITRLKGDVGILFIPHLPPRRNIIELFGGEKFQANCNGFYAVREPLEVKLLDVKNINGITYQHPQVDNYEKFHMYRSNLSVESYKGLCGSGLVAQTYLGNVILGIHTLGKDSDVLASRVTCETLRSFIQDKNPIDVGYPILNYSGSNYELQTLHDYSVPNYVEEGTASVYGSLKGHRSSGKSMVEKTIVADYLIDKEGFKLEHGKPVMKGWAPWRLAFLPMSNPKITLPYDLASSCVKDYFECVGLRCKELHLLEKYSEDISINGVEGVRGVDRIDMTTSSGFPFNKMKKYFFESNGAGFRKWVPKEELRKLIDDCHDRYKSGQRCNFVFMGALKDEPRSFEKIAENNTRVFMGQNVAHLIIGRQYFGSFIRVMQRNRLDFECAIGTNTHSQDWDDIAHFIFDFATNYFDGDYSKYDKEMLAFIIMLIFDEIITFICKFCRDYSETDKTVMRGIAYDIAYAFVNFNGDLVSFLRNNPSGHFLTVIINSICGSTYLRIGFVKATGLPVTRFRDLVRPITYGDDVIVSVKDEIKNEFNFATYQAALKEFNIKFTPANKTGEVYQFREYYELDFLKRSFVVHEDLIRYCAPLAKTSIYKSLVVGTRSKSITAEKQIVQVLSSAHREMYMHGRKEFDKFVALTQRIIQHHELQIFVGRNDFPSYEQLTHQYASGASSMWLSSEQELADYEFQSKCTIIPGEGDRFRNKTTGSYHDSDCTLSNSEEKSENGSWYLTHQGVPQSAYLGKDRLVSKIATLREGLVKRSRSINKTAQNNNNNTDNMQASDDMRKETRAPDAPVQFMQSTEVTTDTAVNFSVENQQHYFDETLNNFLKRPVKLRNYTISTSTTSTLSFDALKDYFDLPYIKRKLVNYRMMRGKMHIRLVVDATPFMGGAYVVAMCPGESVAELPELTDTYLTQKQYAIIDIGKNRDVEMSSPILFNTNYLALEQSAGALAVVISPLKPVYNVMAASATSNIQIFAWMDDVELRGTTGWELQSKVTVMSKENTMQVERDAEQVFFGDKVTSVVTGLPYCGFQEIIKRKVHISQIEWDQTVIAGAALKNFLISPGLASGQSGTTRTWIDDTPMSFFSRYFQYWKGSIKLTFMVIRTAQQSGALRISWDPYGSTVVDAPLSVVKTDVFNIGETQEVTFEIPHENFLGYFQSTFGRSFNTSFFDITKFDAKRDNGVVQLSVVAPLTSPNTSSSVSIAVFVEPGDDFEFGHFIKGPRYTSYDFQSNSTYIGEEYDLKKLLSRPEKVYTTPAMEGANGYSTFRFPIYPLMNGMYSKTVPGPAPEDPLVVTKYTKNIVPAGMLDTINSVGTLPESNVVKGVVSGQTLFARLMDAHVGVRGGMRWTVVLNTLDAQFGPVGTFGFSADNTVSVAWQTPSDVSAKRDYLNQRGDFLVDGQAFHSFYVNPIKEIEVPYFSQYTYLKTRDATTWPSVALTIVPRADGEFFTLYAAAAADTQFVQFRGFSRQYNAGVLSIKE